VFDKRHMGESRFDIDYTSARDLVSEIGMIFGDLCEQGMLVKRRSSLPCPWYVARECFFITYGQEHSELSEQLKDSYHLVYRELSFFIEDKLWQDYERSLSTALQHRAQRNGMLGLSESEQFSKNLIASTTVTLKTREQIFDNLVQTEKDCPRAHLIVLAETLGFCAALYRLMWDEWAAYTTLIAHEDRMKTGK
jgi:hypothetical protein